MVFAIDSELAPLCRPAAISRTKSSRNIRSAAVACDVFGASNRKRLPCPSGNVWVAYDRSCGVVEIIGAAAPVKTPLFAPPPSGWAAKALAIWLI